MILSIYGSHDASATFTDKNDDVRVFEYERFIKIRYSCYSIRFDGCNLGSSDEDRENFLTHIKDNIKKEPKILLYNNIFDSDFDLIKKVFPSIEEFKEMGHHEAHAACAFYQSPYNESLIFSFDGGGADYGIISSTNVYHAKDDNIQNIYRSRLDFGIPYGRIGQSMHEIKDNKDAPELVYAGKVMGICAYGDVKDNLLNPINDYFMHGSLERLGSNLGKEMTNHSIKGQESYDLAATSQYVFEHIVFDFIKKYLSEFNHKINVILTGGCALNVLFNQKLKEYLKNYNLDLYVPSNPSDCGLSLGQYLEFDKKKIEPVVYGGLDILDKYNIEKYSETYQYQDSTPQKIVDLITKGKIGGIINGYSEVGPRALGNRSIICDPSFPDMKDILNAKVKFREWFRPFAPVCREEDMHTYFDNSFVSDYMSYAPSVKNEFRNKLPAITHNDGTARLQTVREDSHKLFYDIISLMPNEKVILNTSFNIKGKPILTTVEDAFYILENTELDFLILENYLIEK